MRRFRITYEKFDLLTTNMLTWVVEGCLFSNGWAYYIRSDAREKGEVLGVTSMDDIICRAIPSSVLERFWEERRNPAEMFEWVDDE